MHVFVIDFVLVPVWGRFALFTWIFTRHHSMSGTCMQKHHTVNSKLSAVDNFPVPDACTCNAVKIPIMSLKCCEKSYVSCRPYCVGWRKYLKLSYAITRCWHTGIHLLYFCTPDFIIWCLGSKVKAALWNSGFIHCKYHTGWTALAMIGTIGGTYAPFCMRMASLFFKVKAQGHTLNIVVVVRFTLWLVQLGLPISIYILILN